MKILFVRHGESVDDIEDRFGGWADFELTEKGKQQVAQSAEKIASLDEKFEVVLSSPLKRASQAAEIIANRLGINVEIFAYLKERNLNGLLTGMVRSEAKEKYPELVKKHEDHEYVLGSEREEDMKERVKSAAEMLFKMKHNSFVCVTHGLFLKVFFKEIMDINVKRVGNGGFALVEETNGAFKVLEADNIDFERTHRV